MSSHRRRVLSFQKAAAGADAAAKKAKTEDIDLEAEARAHRVSALDLLEGFADFVAGSGFRSSGPGGSLFGPSHTRDRLWNPVEILLLLSSSRRSRFQSCVSYATN